MVEIVPSVKKIKKKDIDGINWNVNDNKTKDEQCHLLPFEPKTCRMKNNVQKVGISFLERECAPYL